MAERANHNQARLGPKSGTNKGNTAHVGALEIEYDHIGLLSREVLLHRRAIIACGGNRKTITSQELPQSPPRRVTHRQKNLHVGDSLQGSRQLSARLSSDNAKKLRPGDVVAHGLRRLPGSRPSERFS